MMQSFLSRALLPSVFLIGALALPGMSAGCSSAETLPGSSSSTGGGSGGAASCVPKPGGMIAAVAPWSRGFDIQVSGATADRDAAVIVGAGFRDPEVDLGLGKLHGAETGGDVVAKFSPSGQILWNRSWDGPSAPVVATDACGNVFVARNPADDPTQDPDSSKRSLVVAKLDGDGHDIWQHAFHLEPRIQVTRILITAEGDAIMLGSYQGLIELGKDVLSSPAALTPFIAAFRGSTGETLWNVDVKTDGPIGVGLSSVGEIVVAGNFSRVGKSGVPTGAGPAGSFNVARLSAEGAVQSFAHTGASAPVKAVRLVVSPQGDVGAAGLCPVQGAEGGAEWCMTRFPASGAAAAQQIIDHEPLHRDSAQLAFDAGGNLLMLTDELDPAGPDHLHLATMSPDGAIVPAHDWPTTGGVTPISVEVDLAGGIVFTAVVGILGGATIDVGNGPISPGIVARIAP